jgi:hypothetical protein
MQQETLPGCTSCVQVYRGLTSCTPLSENVSLRVPPSNLRDSRCSALVPLTNTDLLLGAPMLPTWRRVRISTYLQPGSFLSITFTLINPKFTLSVHNPNVLCYVVIVNTHLPLSVCLFVCFSALMHFCSSTFLQFTLHFMLRLSIMQFPVSALCCVCNWLCSCWFGTEIVKN